MLRIRKKKILYNLLTLFSTFLLLLLIGEGVSRLAGVEKYGYDLMFKETGDERVFIPRPNASGFIKGSNVEINSDGLRDYEYSKEKSKDVYRIAVLGASFTFG